MNNLKKYNQFVNEMVVMLNKPKESEIPKEFFTKKEIEMLENNEGGNFNLIEKFKAICLISNRYRLTIHKRKEDEFYYRIKDIKKQFSPVIYENKSKILRDCLYNLDEFIYYKLKEDKEKEEFKKRLEKEKLDKKELGDNDVFSGKSFSGKINM